MVKQNYFKEFKTRATAIGHHAKTLLFHFRRGSMLKQVLSSSWDGRPFGHNRHGPKRGEGCCVHF